MKRLCRSPLPQRKNCCFVTWFQPNQSAPTSWEFNWMQALCFQNNRDERRFLSKSQSGAPSNQKPLADARTFRQTLRTERNRSLLVLGGSDWIVDTELLISELESLHKILIQAYQTHGAFYGQPQTPYKNSLYTFATAEAGHECSLPSGVLTQAYDNFHTFC